MPPPVGQQVNDLESPPGISLKPPLEQLRGAFAEISHFDANRTLTQAFDRHVEGRRRVHDGTVARVTGSMPKLYIFPHAGGSAQYYVPFAKTFSSNVKCTAVQYPGRRGTHDLGSFTSIPDLF